METTGYRLYIICIVLFTFKSRGQTLPLQYKHFFVYLYNTENQTSTRPNKVNINDSAFP